MLLTFEDGKIDFERVQSVSAIFPVLVYTAGRVATLQYPRKGQQHRHESCVYTGVPHSAQHMLGQYMREHDQYNLFRARDKQQRLVDRLVRAVQQRDLHIVNNSFHMSTFRDWLDLFRRKGQ